MNVIIRPQFYQDLEEEVYWLLANAGPNVARRWHAAVWDTLETLRAYPGIGRERKDLKQPGIRSWRVNHFKRWLIFYEVRKTKLLVYRVRSGVMDLTRIEMRS